MPGALRAATADSAGGPTDGHYSESYGRSLFASAGPGAAAGGSARSRSQTAGGPTDGLCSERRQAIQYRRPSSPRPSPPAAGGEGECFAVLERLRLGLPPSAVLLRRTGRPQPRSDRRKEGWTHCKELTETYMLSPCRRGS